MKDTNEIIDTVNCVNALDYLKELPDNCINSIITSPPYFGQRDYGHQDQIGLEETPEEYISSLMLVFQECKRVLKNDGTFWLNIGDYYVGATSQHKEGGSQGKSSRYSQKHMNGLPKSGRAKRNKYLYSVGFPMKSLLGMPWRTAFRLQESGWILRSDIIWHHPSASESVKDRPTHAHEYVFMFSKKQWYYYDRKFMLTETGANIQSVWRITGSPFSGQHCATFPPELIEKIVLTSCPEGGVVLDPFGGSGTVGLVCKQYNRHYVLCDISQDIVDLAKKRIDFGITSNDKKRLKERGIE